MYDIAIDLELCQGCGDCVDACPTMLFSIAEDSGKKHAVVSGDAEDCIGCLSCETACPEGAIAVTEQ